MISTLFDVKSGAGWRDVFILVSSYPSWTRSTKEKVHTEQISGKTILLLSYPKVSFLCSALCFQRFNSLLPLFRFVLPKISFLCCMLRYQKYPSCVPLCVIKSLPDFHRFINGFPSFTFSPILCTSVWYCSSSFNVVEFWNINVKDNDNIVCCKG